MKQNIRVQRVTAALWEVDLMGLRGMGWVFPNEYEPEAVTICARRGSKPVRRLIVDVWREWFQGTTLTPQQIRRAEKALQAKRGLVAGPRARRARSFV